MPRGHLFEVMPKRKKSVVKEKWLVWLGPSRQGREGDKMRRD